MEDDTRRSLLGLSVAYVALAKRLGATGVLDVAATAADLRSFGKKFAEADMPETQQQLEFLAHLLTVGPEDA